MDINIVKKNLEENYNCYLINIINYLDKNFVKALENIKEFPTYRYFAIKKNNDLEEIIDNQMLNYFRENNETNDNVEY